MGQLLNGETGHTLQKNDDFSFVLIEFKGSGGHSSTDAQEADSTMGTVRTLVTDGIIPERPVQWGGKGAKGRKHQHLRDGKRKQSSLKRELRMQPEKSRKARRVCPWTLREGDIWRSLVSKAAESRAEDREGLSGCYGMQIMRTSGWLGWTAVHEGRLVNIAILSGKYSSINRTIIN